MKAHLATSSSRPPFCVRCLCNPANDVPGGWRYFDERLRIGICSLCTTHGDRSVEAKRRETREQLKAAVGRYVKSARAEFEAPPHSEG